MKKHMDWVDQYNVGVSHLGVHPDKLRRANIRFDVFHLRSAITRRLLNYLRTFMLKQSCNTMKHFSDLLSNVWGKYTMTIWDLNKNFSSLTGNEIKAFISYIPNVVQFLRSSFETIEHVENISQGLEIWAKIIPFLHIQLIHDCEKYQQSIGEFKQNVK